MEHPERTDDGVGIGAAGLRDPPHDGSGDDGCAKDLSLRVIPVEKTLLPRGNRRVVIGLAQHAGEGP